ncbi:hypothetical protein PsorP6_004973 [Peronosclerospora sorghi]|uniref:Uncharacterized protein n=1 Tax=Peronosclerospora sorghi TaxID=230839 RepID=A0ACC0W3K6_9STRA|nr:hypothetical protein PsorP6_004973 [Peronosclerospora sorghi]
MSDKELWIGRSEYAQMFALEEQLAHWKNEAAAVTAAMQRRIDALETEKEQVETEWSHARTENTLLMKTLEHCRGEMDDTRRELHKVLEHKLQALKQMAQKALQSLQTESGKLVEAEKRVEKLEDERDKIRTVLHEKETGNEALRIQREELLQHVATLMKQVEYGQDKISKAERAAETTIDRLTRAEAALTESVKSLRRDLMEAESCVVVLVEERDETKKTLTAKELMIETLTAQQSELALAVQKLETELKTLRSKRSAETEAHEEMIGYLEKENEIVHTLQESLRRAEPSLELVQAQIGASELRVAKLEEERDVARTFLTEKESSHESLSAVQKDLQQKVCALELELRALRETSAAKLAAAKETITSLERSKEEAAATLACAFLVVLVHFKRIPIERGMVRSSTFHAAKLSRQAPTSMIALILAQISQILALILAAISRI